MKISLTKIIVLAAILLVLIGISGGIYAYAQEQKGLGEEPTQSNQTAGAILPKVPDQDVQGDSSSPVGGPGGEVTTSGADLSDKQPAINPAPGSSTGADQNAPGGDIAVPDSPDVNLKWYTMAGAVFIPYSNLVTWDYGGSGCIKPATVGYWRASVNIPDGSILKQVYFGFFNTLTSAPSTAYLYRYNYAGGYVTVAQVNSLAGSVGTTGYKFTSITFPAETVVNYTNAYAFAWSGSTTQQLCYIQVGYIPATPFALALPEIMNKP